LAYKGSRVNKDNRAYKASRESREGLVAGWAVAWAALAVDSAALVADSAGSVAWAAGSAVDSEADSVVLAD
jgi:hypothetical protein